MIQFSESCGSLEAEDFTSHFEGHESAPLCRWLLPWGVVSLHGSPVELFTCWVCYQEEGNISRRLLLKGSPKPGSGLFQDRNSQPWDNEIQWKEHSGCCSASSGMFSVMCCWEQPVKCAIGNMWHPTPREWADGMIWADLCKAVLPWHCHRLVVCIFC